jgi:arginine deiminase
MSKTKTDIRVTSEIGTLKRLLVHSPDSGLGKVVPSKAQDWLFEDIVHLDTIRRKEYDYYTKILLYFLDPGKIKGRLGEIDDDRNRRNFFKPDNENFYRSERVIELQWLLSDILEDHEIKLKLVAAVCAIENCSYTSQEELLSCSPVQLAKVFVSGTINEQTMIFPPIPNFIFTRDIGIVINDYILLNKPAKKARTREAMLMKYIFYNHPLFVGYQDKILEISDSALHFLIPRETDEKKVTLEGGDVMVITRDHVLIGVSERTTMEAVHQVSNLLFEKNIVKKITVIKIPKRRDYMHIDTIFTQIKRDMWVMLGSFSRKRIKMEDADPVQKILEVDKKDEKIKIIQFKKKHVEDPVFFDNLEELLIDISKNDFDSKGHVRFIYSGNNEFPFDAREQWTDSCNLLALKEGVVLGYDRNDKTVEAFRHSGFNIVHAQELLQKLEADEIHPDSVTDTMILIPSAELSRARGGFHCMSMPLLRDDVD